MKRMFAAVLVCVLLLCCLSGCAPELHERLIIRAVGVDAAEEGYRVTVRVVADDGKEKSFTESSYTVAGALEIIAAKTGKKPLYSHNALLVFGDRCAKQGLQGALDFFLRHYDSRPAVKVFLAENTAEELLTVTTEGDVSSEQIAALMHGEKYSGSVMDADLITLINGIYGANRSAVLPVLHNGDILEITGAGVISDMQLRAVLNTEALRGYLLLSRKLQAVESMVHNANCGTVTVAADKSACAIVFTGTKENPRFTVNVKVEGDISSVSAGNRRIESTVYSELESQLAGVMLDRVRAYLDTAVYGEGCDASGFGHAALTEEAAVARMNEDAFSTFLKNAVVEIEVTAKINRVEEEDKPYL